MQLRGHDGQGKQQEELRRNLEQISDPGRCTQLFGNLEIQREGGWSKGVETKTPGQAARIRHFHICTEKWEVGGVGGGHMGT